MPTYRVTIDGATYRITSDRDLSDQEAYQAAATSPDALKAKNDRLRAANEKPLTDPVLQPGAGVRAFVQGAYEGDPRVPFSGAPKDLTEGVQDVVAGNVARGAHKVVRGVGKVTAPLALPVFAAAPIPAAVAVGGGLVGGAGARKVAEVAGATPDQQDLAEDVGGLAGGTAGAKVGGMVLPVMRRGATAAVQSVAEANPKFMKVLPKGQEILDAAQELDARNRPNAYRAAELGVDRNATAADMPTYPETPAADLGKGRASIPLDYQTRNAAALDEIAKELGIDLQRQPNAEGVQGRSAQKFQTQELLRREGTTPLTKDNLGTPVRELSSRQANAGAPVSGAIDPRDVARDYAQQFGFPEPKAHSAVAANEELGKQVADAYQAMEHNPNNPEVRKSYEALAREVSQQFKFIVDRTGLKVEPWTGKGQPYANSKAMRDDVRMNNHMWYFPTEQGFGSAGANADATAALKARGIVSAHPLERAGESGLPVNDELRVVHDYLAHAVGGHQFGPSGEENAFLEHLKLLSPPAQRALATETRGQNSWVNFGPHMRDAQGNLLRKGQPGFLPPSQRPFAEQKVGLLPDELIPEITRARSVSPLKTTAPSDRAALWLLGK